MPDYKEMYRILFRETAEVILALQKVQQQTEEMYIADDAADDFIVIGPNAENDNDNREKHPPQG